MADGDLVRLQDRVRQNRTARERELETARGKPLSADSTLGRTFVAGDRVFDLVTGQEGTVIDGTRENVVVPAAAR